MIGNLAKLAGAVERADLKPPKLNPFLDRRAEPRLWCSELVHLWIKPSVGGRWRRSGTGVLEDISRSGACLNLEGPIHQGTLVRIKHPEWKAEGEVRYCLYKEDGYFVGVYFDEQSRWSETGFRPGHLLDPSQVKPRPPKAGE